MIYVTVGTLRPFPRLICKMDEIAAELSEEVIMQIATDDYKPRHSRYFQFCKLEDQSGYMEAARIVVAHAGVGTVRTLANLGKRSVFVVRRPEYGEVINDHQMEFARGLEKRGVKIRILYDVDKLKDILTGNIDDIPVPPVGDDSQLIHRLRQSILELSEGRR